MKKLVSIFAILLFISPAFGQQYGYKWRFGFSAGTTNYFGDIRPLGIKNFDQFTKLYKRYNHYSENLSYQASIEYALGNSVGLMFTAGSYQFGSGDRFVKNDGTLYTEGMNFDRALNFQTNVTDAGLSFVIKPDNNWLLSGKSFFAPYIVLGLGVQSFNVYGDLLDADGNEYNYKNLNVIPDGTFETSLRELETEVVGGYNKATMYANLGLGFRIRIAKGIEIFAQSDFKRAATDYLDDVSGVYRTSYDNDFQQYAAKPGTNLVTLDNPYRGMENGKGDWYIYHGIGVKFSLGANKESFNPPVISQRYTFVPTELSAKQMEKADSTQVNAIQSAPVTNNYFTVIQLPSWEQNGFMRDSTAMDSVAKAELELVRDSLLAQRATVQSDLLQSQNQLAQIDETIELARRDSTVSAEITETRVASLENERSIANGQLTSLNTIDAQIEFKLDSIQAVEVNDEVHYMDSTAMMKQLLIYPGQVSKILYSASGPTEVYLDSLSANQDSTQVMLARATSATDSTNSDMMSKEEFEEKMEEFRSEMLQAQAKRDSAMIMAFASRIPEPQEYEPQETEPQELQVNTEAMDEKTAKKMEKNRKKQEKLEKKNNELLKDALLVGGTAAATSAIANSGDKKAAEEQARRDSLMMAQIKADSILIDSLQRITTVTPTPDTVVVEKSVPTLSHALLNQSKIEIFFGINQTGLTSSEEEKLKKVIEVLNENPDLGLELTGYADNTGTVSYNLQISSKRVASVKDYFISQGIEESRINSDVGGLIIRGATKGSSDSDRKVEVRFREN